MLVRLRHARRIAPDSFRLTLDLVDPDRPLWEPGDCMVRIDVLDAPRHDALPRGPLKSALELFQLSPESPPATADARLLWDMGQAVHAYVGRLFEAGVLCPFAPRAENPSAERSQ